MLLDLRSLFETAAEQISDGASRIARRVGRPISRVTHTVHSWTSILSPSGADTLTATAFHPRVRTRSVVLASGADQLSATCTHVRGGPLSTAVFCEGPKLSFAAQRTVVNLAGAVPSLGSSDDDDVDLALEEEEENRARMKPQE